MLVTPESNRRNRHLALALAGAAALAFIVVGWFFPISLVLLCLSPAIYWLARRCCLRRLKIMSQPFPVLWEGILQSHVAFFRALSDQEKQRFRLMVQVFLAEVRITAIRTDMDETVRVLVAADRSDSLSQDSMIGNTAGWAKSWFIPSAFGEKFQTAGEPPMKIAWAWSACNISAG